MDGKLRNMTSLYLTKEDSVLCLYRIGSRVANQMYIGSAGGHFECDELNDAKKCVLREAYEELGIREEDLLDMKMRYITLRLKNGDVMVRRYPVSQKQICEINAELYKSEKYRRKMAIGLLF